MIECLDSVGVKILDFRGNLRPTEDVMIDVAKAIIGIEDPAKRSAAAVDFFGKAGTRLPAAAGRDCQGCLRWPPRPSRRTP